ncbi:hypothetical protein [Nonomuraea diastatica]|nr:hypothetical protein [Nonomuraea diastatica]
MALSRIIAGFVLGVLVVLASAPTAQATEPGGGSCANSEWGAGGTGCS